MIWRSTKWGLARNVLSLISTKCHQSTSQPGATPLHAPRNLHPSPGPSSCSSTAGGTATPSADAAHRAPDTPSLLLPANLLPHHRPPVCSPVLLFSSDFSTSVCIIFSTLAARHSLCSDFTSRPPSWRNASPAAPGTSISRLPPCREPLPFLSSSTLINFLPPPSTSPSYTLPVLIINFIHHQSIQSAFSAGALHPASSPLRL